MTAEELRDYIDDTLTDVEFSYDGVDGAICPTSRTKIYLGWGDKEITYKSLDEMMNDTSIFGASLNSITSQLVFY